MQEQLRQQYKEQIRQHYLMAGSDVLILGHCNITQNKIYEIVDHTNSGLLERFGDVREEFFRGIGTLIVNEEERKEFYSKYLNIPSKQAFENGVNEVLQSCFIQLPNQTVGRYVQFKVVLVETPDTGDVTGILTITDITEKVIREKIFMQLSSAKYDLVANINLFSDSYEIVSGGDDNILETKGNNTDRIEKVIQETMVENQREREHVRDMLNPSKMLKRLKKKSSYSFLYSVYNAKGELRTKNMIVSAVDLSLGRVCYIRSDVTEVLAAERKAKEELEQALEEAKKANRVKSDFLSSMSHDIRTPMNAIVGMTTLALANMEEKEKVAEYLHKISISSQHLLSLINDILDMSQIEQSKIHLNCQKIQIEELMDHVSSIMSSQAVNAGLQFKIEGVPLEEMVQTLEQVPEEAWGRYAFAREPLEGKFTEEQKIEYIRKANVCGRQWAERIANVYCTRDSHLLARQMGLHIKTPNVPTGGGVVLFAQYVQPDEITIFMDCVEKAAQLQKKSGCTLLEKETLTKILLAHELFHAVEELHEKEIYTRTEEVELWRKPFSNRSAIVPPEDGHAPRRMTKNGQSLVKKTGKK